MTTTVTKPENIQRHWHIIDAEDQILGRLAVKIARLLIGKDKTYFSPNLDCGDYVVVINSDKIRVTGKKMDDKIYYRHSNYPGGLKAETLKSFLGRDSTRVIETAVKGMLPKNKLQDPRLRRLKAFPDTTHPYQDKLKEKDAN